MKNILYLMFQHYNAFLDTLVPKKPMHGNYYLRGKNGRFRKTMTRIYSAMIILLLVGCGNGKTLETIKNENKALEIKIELLKQEILIKETERLRDELQSYYRQGIDSTMKIITQ